MLAAAASPSPMLSSSTTLHPASPAPNPNPANPNARRLTSRFLPAAPSSTPSGAVRARGRPPMGSVRTSSAAGAGGPGAAAVGGREGDLTTERLVEVAQRAADAAGEVLRKYFRQRVEIIDKEDHSPVTIADKEAEEAMVSVILKSFPNHAIYTTSPHLFEGAAEDAFIRVRNQVKVPLYGCDCYAYALLASGWVDLVVESGLKPYDFLSLVPVIEGAGGSITDWRGDKLHWPVTAESCPTSFNVVAAGDARVHKQALDVLQWR